MRTGSWVINSPIPSQHLFRCYKMTQSCWILLLAVLNWWEKMWTTWSVSGSINTRWTQPGAAVRCSTGSYFNSVLCHSTESESESLCFQSFACLILRASTNTALPQLPPRHCLTPIYSLLNLIDRARYLWWVSGQWGFGNGTEMSMHGDCMKVISIFVLSHCYIFTNLWWMIHVASGGLSAFS